MLMNKLKIGDTIPCHDWNDLYHTQIQLAMSGIETKIDEAFGELRLVVTEVKE